MHVGVDVPKASYSVARFSDRRGLLTTWVQPARPELLIERLRPLRARVHELLVHRRLDQVVRIRIGPEAGRELVVARR
jgi:hypothetical protein